MDHQLLELLQGNNIFPKYAYVNIISYREHKKIALFSNTCKIIVNWHIAAIYYILEFIVAAQLTVASSQHVAS